MNATDIFQTAALGFGTGLALIVAIGAQNAFVLRQGILGRHVAPVVAVCALSDAALIAAGILGMDSLVRAAPPAVVVLRYAGAAFLIAYGTLAARRAIRPRSLTSDGGAGAAPAGTGGPGPALTTVLALTWLNPHVYLDTMLLLGTVANAQQLGLRWWFGIGAMLASLLWFGALGFGARLLRGLFSRAAAWRMLDGAIAVTMTSMGTALALGT